MQAAVKAFFVLRLRSIHSRSFTMLFSESPNMSLYKWPVLKAEAGASLGLADEPLTSE